MKNNYTSVSLLLLAALTACSPQTQQPVTADSSPLPPANVSSLKPFEPDQNWIITTEVVSQYSPDVVCRDVVIDGNGIVWMASWAGVVSYNPETKQFTNHTVKEGLSHHRVYSVMKDSKGNMWFGTLGAGAYRYDGTRFTNLSSINGMANNVVMDLFEDSKGNIWFATNSGASCYDGKSFVNLDSVNGLQGEMYAVAEDQNGNVWLGGAYGLFQANAGVIAGTEKATEILTDFQTHFSNVRDLRRVGNTMYVGCSAGLYATQESQGKQPSLIAIDNKFTGYINETRTTDLLQTADGIYRYNTTVYEAHQSPAPRWITVIDGLNNLGVFGAREAVDGTIWFGAMDGLYSVKDGKTTAYKKP